MSAVATHDPPPKIDNSYVSGDTKDVMQDDKVVENPIDPRTADTDEQLARDEAEAIDESNILKDRTRHAKPTGPGYDEGPGEESIVANEKGEVVRG